MVVNVQVAGGGGGGGSESMEAHGRALLLPTYEALDAFLGPSVEEGRYRVVPGLKHTRVWRIARAEESEEEEVPSVISVQYRDRIIVQHERWADGRRGITYDTGSRMTPTTRSRMQQFGPAKARLVYDKGVARVSLRLPNGLHDGKVQAAHLWVHLTNAHPRLLMTYDPAEDQWAGTAY